MIVIEWSLPAKDDLMTIAEYIAADDPVAALDVIDRIDSAVGRLADHPGSGRPGRIAKTRELVIPSLPYIIAYRLRENRVQILRVLLHTARRWPGLA